MSKETQEIYERVASLARAGYLISFAPEMDGSIHCKIKMNSIQFSALGINIVDAFEECEKRLTKGGGLSDMHM